MTCPPEDAAPVDPAPILARCRELGFALAGVAHLASSRYANHVRAWIASGRHGTMTYLADGLETRLNPAALLPGARAAIVVADRYAPRGGAMPSAPEAPECPAPRIPARIARYAQGRDYHDIVKRRLHALSDELRALHPRAEFRTCVDSAPIMERELAERAGLGWIGKHTLLIHPEFGSWFLLGVVLTTLDLRTSDTPVPDHCGSCTRCIDACPTGCITPWSVDASRCIAYLTIERREPIPPDLSAHLGEWLFGCDVCQEVCPHNSARSGAWREAHPEPMHPGYASRADAIDALDVLAWTASDRASARLNEATRRAKLALIQRNAAHIAGGALNGNHGAQARARLEALAGDPGTPHVVRDAARRALASSGRPEPNARCADTPNAGTARQAPPPSASS